MRGSSDDAAHLRETIMVAMTRDGAPKSVAEIAEMVDTDLSRAAYNVYVLTDHEYRLERITEGRRDLYRVPPRAERDEQAGQSGR